MSETACLRWQDLSFSYPERHVLTGASGRIGPGLHWLQGANGSGKSTLLKLLAGVLRPSWGRCELRGPDGRWLAPDVDPLAWRRELCWCGPGPLAFDHLSIDQLLAWLPTLYPPFDRRLAERLLSDWALATWRTQPLSTLSTGNQRKAALIAVLSAGTRLRLIDEPFNALDPAARAVLAEVLRELAPQAVWLVASHEWVGPAPAQVLTVGHEQVTPAW